MNGNFFDFNIGHAINVIGLILVYLDGRNKRQTLHDDNIRQLATLDADVKNLKDRLSEIWVFLTKER